jgi:hypothetical protein
LLVPLFGFLQGDSLGLLVLVHDDDTIRVIAQKVQQAASLRVAPRGPMSVRHAARVLPPDLGVVEAGLVAFDRVDVVPEGG